jgi:hypothetical protein
MKRILLVALALAAVAPPAAVVAQRRGAAERAWGPFFRSFRAAVRRRDRAALRPMMAAEFYFHTSGGDDNGDGDSRDEALEYWSEPRVNGWAALEKTLAAGAVPNTAMRGPGDRRPSRVAPPAANNRRAIRSIAFEHYAVFEFRDGRWYCIAFAECCDL